MATTRPARQNSRLTVWLLVALGIIVLDQFTKVLIMGAFSLYDKTPVTSFFNIVRAHNTGAAFSFLSDASGWQNWFFFGLGCVAVVVITWLLRRASNQKLFSAALALILGGAIGNLIDRLWHGYVIDFLDFYWGMHHFPAFNVADSAITVGAIFLVLDELLRVARSKS